MKFCASVALLTVRGGQYCVCPESVHKVSPASAGVVRTKEMSDRSMSETNGSKLSPVGYEYAVYGPQMSLNAPGT